VQLNSFTMKILDLPWAPSCCFSEVGRRGKKGIKNLQDQPVAVVPMLLAQAGRREEQGNPSSPAPVMMLGTPGAPRSSASGATSATVTMMLLMLLTKVAAERRGAIHPAPTCASPLLAASTQGGTTCHDAFLGSQCDNQMRLGPSDFPLTFSIKVLGPNQASLVLLIVM
jgi:hypothetical protein